MIEFLLAFAKNLSCLFDVLALVFGIFTTVGGGFCLAESCDEDKPKVWKLIKKGITVTLLLGLVSCLPTIEDIWKVRIALIKYQMASPENIKSGTETIERIAKKLECKYLSCEDTKEKK